MGCMAVWLCGCMDLWVYGCMAVWLAYGCRVLGVGCWVWSGAFRALFGPPRELIPGVGDGGGGNSRASLARQCPAISPVSCATSTPNALDVCNTLSAWWGRSSSAAKMDWLLVPLAHFKQCTQQPPDKCLGPFGLNKTQQNVCCLAFRQAHPLCDYIKCL